MQQRCKRCRLAEANPTELFKIQQCAAADDRQSIENVTSSKIPTHFFTLVIWNILIGMYRHLFKI